MDLDFMSAKSFQRVWITLIMFISYLPSYGEIPNIKLNFIEEPVLPTFPIFQENNQERSSNQDQQALQGYIEEFEKRYGTSCLENQYHRDFLSLIRNNLYSNAFSSEQQNAVHFLKIMLEELSRANYSKEGIEHYLNWSLNLSSALFFKTYQYAQPELNDLFYQVVDSSFESIVPKSIEESGRHKSFALRNKRGEVTALVKIVKAPRNAWAPIAPIMEQGGSAGLYEKAGYDFDVILGLKMTPATLLGRVQLENGTIEDVVIQKFISDTAVLSELLYRENGAHLLMSLPKAPAQMIALSGMIKGRLGGHLGNYLFHLQGEKIDTIYDIDLEELLPPCNRLEKGMTLYPLKEDRGQVNRIDAASLGLDLEDAAYKSVPLCRMCILGLPQNGQPFERACLKLIVHPIFPYLLDEYHEHLKEKKEIRLQCLYAQKERLLKIQQICKRQLELPKITLTPRDLYFYLFGGQHLYQMARERGYPPLVIFNQVVGDPLQHSIIDFSRPEKMLFYNTLKESHKSNEKVARNKILFRNLQSLEEQEKK